MSYLKNTGIAALTALLCGGAAFFWLHNRAARTQAESAHSSALDAKVMNTPRASSSANDIKSSHSGDKAAEPKKTSGEKDAEGPLRAGEALEFTANVAKLNNVANLRVRVAERRNFLGKNAWHFQAFAHTENPLRMVFALDDQFDSYSDAGMFTSLQYEMRLDERGQKVQSLQRMSTAGKDPAPADATAAVVPPGTRDPLGMLEYLRSVDWAKTPEVRSPVYDGQKLYDVRASLAGGFEKVAVPAGSYTASKIELRVFENGTEMKDSHFFLYLANTPTRTPVLLEAQLPFANARVELLRAQ
ncbi:MAG: DUF3108 domain-containing protein [Candidatus Acidiferrales bacterium]